MINITNLYFDNNNNFDNNFENYSNSNTKNVFEHSKYLTHIYKDYEYFDITKSCYKFNLKLSKYYNKIVEIAKNISLVFELDNDEIIQPELFVKIITDIKIQFNGHDIEHIHSNWILAMIIFYGLSIKQVGSKIFLPLPFNIFQNGFVPYYISSIVFLVKFNSTDPLCNKIKKINIRVEQLYRNLIIDNKYPSNQINFMKLGSNKKLLTEELQNKNSIYLFTQSYCELIELTTETFGSNSSIHTIHRHSDKFVELFFCFTDKNTSNIVKDKVFEKITLTACSCPLWSLTYEELEYDLFCQEKYDGTNNKYLLEGFYRIPFENIRGSKQLVLNSYYEYMLQIEYDKSNKKNSNYEIEIYGLYQLDLDFLYDKQKSNLF